MSGRQAALVVILSAVLAACGAGGEPTLSEPSSVAASDAQPSPAKVTAAPTISTASPSPSVSLEPTSEPTPKPAPPKPTGVTFDWESESICDPDTSNPEFLCEVSGVKYSLSWTAPLSKGVEIRVYGVTECLSDDAQGTVIDGWCLREHTALSTSDLVLLSKGPASKGTMTWSMNEYGRLDGYIEDDTYYAGDPFYSVVLAAYDTDGEHSIFAIADVTHLCNVIESMECPDDTDWLGDDDEEDGG